MFGKVAEIKKQHVLRNMFSRIFFYGRVCQKHAEKIARLGYLPGVLEVACYFSAIVRALLLRLHSMDRHSSIEYFMGIYDLGTRWVFLCLCI